MSKTERLAVMIVCLNCAALSAQQPSAAKPEKEHAWLKQFVGEWTSQSEAAMESGQPAVTYQGTMKSRMLGDLWVVSDVTVDVGDTHVSAVQTIGYDPAQKKFVGTWVDSAMNHLWHYEGTLDDTGKKITLQAKGPSFIADGKITTYRDAFEFQSADHIVTTSSVLGDDGEWVTFMTGHLRRAP